MGRLHVELKTVAAARETTLFQLVERLTHPAFQRKEVIRLTDGCYTIEQQPHVSRL